MNSNHRNKGKPSMLRPVDRPCPIITDPQGCYTGRPIETYEIPVQDADDL